MDKPKNIFDEMMSDYDAVEKKDVNTVSLGYTETGYEVQLGMSEMGHTLISGISRSGKSQMAKSMLKSIVKFASVVVYSPKAQDYVEFMKDARVVNDINEFSDLVLRTVGILERRNEALLQKSIKAGKSVRCTDQPMLLVVDEFATATTMMDDGAMRALKRLIAEGAGLNIYLMIITQVATKKVLSDGLKDNILTLIAFKARDAYSARMALGNREPEFLRLGQGIVMNVDKKFKITRLK